MEADKPSLNVVVIGHVDHGKSTLLGRLIYDAGLVKPEKVREVEKTAKELGRKFEFAYFMDNVREEREEQKTIDVIYTPFETGRFKITFIDAPGHRELLRNMLTGASQANAAVLVVSAKADEGVREQTRRHLLLADFLGLRELLVVVNKMDAVGYDQLRYQKLSGEIASLLSSLGFDPAQTPIVPLSAREGENILSPSKKMAWYHEGCFRDFLDRQFSPVAPLSKLPLRLSVQDVSEGAGEVLVVGKVETGVLRVGSQLKFLPSGNGLKVASVRSFSGDLREEAVAGEMAIIVPESVSKEAPCRGEVGGEVGDLPPSRTEFSGKIFVLAGKLSLAERGLSLRCGLAERTCQVTEITTRFSSETGEVQASVVGGLEADDLAIVRLRVGQPLVAESFSQCPPLGRFTLRQAGRIVAAGIVV